MIRTNPTGLAGIALSMVVAACSTVPTGLPPGMPGGATPPATSPPASGSTSASVPLLPPAPVASASTPVGMPTATPTSVPAPGLLPLPMSGDKKLSVSFASSTVKAGSFSPGVATLDVREWIPQAGKFTLTGRILADGRWKAVTQEYSGNPPRMIFFEVEPVWTPGKVTGYFTVTGPNGDLTIVATSDFTVEATTSPTPVPTTAPTAAPTPVPTTAPTAAPTPVPTPTASPSGTGGL